MKQNDIVTLVQGSSSGARYQSPLTNSNLNLHQWKLRSKLITKLY